MATKGYNLEQTGEQVQAALNKAINLGPATEEADGLMTATDKASLEHLNSVIDTKVDKVTGKGLSTNDFTNEDKDKLDTAYQVPSTGIPAADLSSGVQTSLGKANTAVQPADLVPITEKIPAQASAQNQLADKAFVNSSISTASADFKGTYDSLVELQAVTADKNDYGYVVSTDEAGNTVYSRYKYNGSSWVFEYDLNNSSFTAAEWAAIQSGITAPLVQKLGALPTNADLQTALSGKQATLVSGTNIKTVDGQSILGSGNLSVSDPNAVKVTAQTWTDAQKTQARTNIGAYAKPSGGIPKTDLASGVQGSLDLADSAIQARPSGEVDPTITPAEYATQEEVSELRQELHGINVGTWELGTIGVADVGTMEVPSVFTNFAIRTKNITALFSGNCIFTPGSGWEIRILVANGKRTDNTYYSTPVTVAINKGDVFRLALRTIPQYDLSSNTSAQIQTLVANSGFSAISDGIVEVKSIETRVTKVEGDIEKINNILSSFSVGSWEVGAIGSAPVGTMTVPDVFTNYAARTKNITAEKSGSYSFKIGSGWLVKLIVANGVRDDSNYYQEITQEIASGQVYRLAVKTDPNQTDFSNYTSTQLSALVDSAGFVSLINGDNIALDIAKDAKEKADAVYENYTTVDLQTYLDNAGTGYITYSGGTLQPHDGYRHTSPIPLKKGEKIVFVGDSVSLCAVFASCESDGSNCFPLMQGISPIGESATYQYFATNDTYIIISYVYHSDVTFNTAKTVRDSFVYEASRGASLTTEAESGLISISDNPLSLVKETPGYSGAIRSWGFVGDSLASGVFFGYKDGVEWSDTNYDISWGQFMVRAMSAEGKNYSVGGQTAKWWVNNYLPPTERSLAGVQADTPKQAYIIALGVNDNGYLSTLYNNTVATDMEDIAADIDLDNPSNNANTFAGWYARVIQEIKAVAPDALIFVTVIPELLNADINTVIRSMPSIFATKYPNSVWAIDLYTYKPSQQYLSAFKMNGAHLNAQGYQYFSWVFMTYIDWLIRKNMSAFKGLCFIGTGAHINND